jgi:hypothetical protein
MLQQYPPILLATRDDISELKWAAGTGKETTTLLVRCSACYRIQKHGADVSDLYIKFILLSEHII